MRLHGDLARLRRLTRQRIIRRYLASTDTPSLHIGCGGSIKSGWLNVDRYNAEADTYLDARARFPFEDGSFAYIYTEHMIEHIEIDRVRSFLSESLRVLRPGGLLRITCPDLALYARAYVNADDAFFDRVLQGIEHKRRKRPELAWVVRGNGAAFMTGVVKPFHGHRWMYDFDTLKACLRETGFRGVRKRAFHDVGDRHFENMDNPEREFETLYVESRAPEAT